MFEKRNTMPGDGTAPPARVRPRRLRSGIVTATRSAASTLGALALLTACDPPAEPVGSTAPDRVLTGFLHSREASLADDFEIAWRSGLTLTSDGVALVDAGTHRVHLLNRDLTSRTSFGRAGEGPGELAFPQGIVSHDGRLYVADVGTGRVSVFDEAGGLITAQALPAASDNAAIAVTGSGLLAAAISDPQVRVATAANESWTYRREGRTGPVQPPPADRPPVTFRRIAGGLADTVYLLEDQLGEVVAIPEVGAPRSVARVPAELMERIAARSRASLVALVGEETARTSSSNYFKSFSRAPDGTLTALFDLDGVAGIHLDPATGVVSRLVAGEDRRLRSVVRGALAGVVHRDTLFLLSRSGVHLIGVR